jgi:tripeptide aminopeptidase
VVQLDAVVGDLLDLLRIDSPTYGEREAAGWLTERLAELGVSARDDGTAEALGGNSGNLIARVPGNRDAPPLLLNAHMDNVPPCTGVSPVVDGYAIRTDGRTVLGTDDKGGCIALLTALREVVTNDLAHPPLEVVFTAAEEVGLEGAKALDFAALRARWGFVAESGTLGAITIAAPSAERWEARVHGKAAHSGVCPEQGVNAIRIAAEAIAAMRIGRLDEETTGNVGIISGGEARNIVPPECLVVGEARSHNGGKLAGQMKQVRDCFAAAAAKNGGTVDLQTKRSYNAFRVAPDEWPVVLAQQAARDVGVDPAPRPTGGGSDANVFNENGIRCVVLCTGAHNVHTPDEFIDVRDLLQAARWFVRVIALAAETPR